MKRAFTLIELLVVIAIISILAAILFPVLAQAKISAKQIQCIAQYRQVAIAHQMYLTDNDDAWAGAFLNIRAPSPYPPQQPWVGYDNSNISNGSAFYGSIQAPAVRKPRAGALDPYIKNYDVLKCPSMPSKWQMAMAYNWFYPGNYSAYYSVNPRAQGNEFGPGAREVYYANDGTLVSLGAQNSEMEEPAYTLIGWEHGHPAPVCNFLQGPNWFESPPAGPSGQAYLDHFHFLHRGGANTIWGDSHAKRIAYGNLKRPMFSLRKDIYR